MGTRNPAYTEDQFNPANFQMRPVQMSSYAKDTPINDPAMLYHQGETPEHTYLAPRIPGYNTDDVILQCKKENVYDALGQYRDEHKVEAMKKRNLCYETTQVSKRPVEPKSFQPRGKKRKYRRCLPFLLFLIGILSLGAFTITLLQYFGILKFKGAASTSGASQGSTGASRDAAYSEKLKQLESNITFLKLQVTPQAQEIESLRNATKENEKIINSLKKDLELEQAKTQNLSSTMKSLEERLKAGEVKTFTYYESLVQLKELHDVLNKTTISSTQLLAAEIKELEKKLNDTKTTMQSLNQTNKINNLEKMMEEETKYRQGNDSALDNQIKANELIRQQSIANLSADLSALDSKTMQSIRQLEARINSSISTEVTKLEASDQTLFSQVTNVNTTFLHMIQNISLTPGPQGPTGPSGAGNLTGCNESTSMVHSTHSIKMAAFQPVDYVKRVIVGISCYATLPAGITISDHDATAKKCECDVGTAPSKYWECRIRIWTCPKTS